MNLINQYDEHGYVVLRNLLSDKELSSIDYYVDRIYKEWVSENEPQIIQNKLVNMHSLTSPEYFKNRSEERVDFFQAISLVKLTNAIESIFGSGIYFHNTQLFFNPLSKEQLPYWHRDMQYSPIEDTVQRDEQLKMLSLHIRIPLVNEKGVELVTGSHKRWDSELEKSVRFELNGHTNNEPLPNSKLIDLAFGDVLIFNAQMIHRGNYALNSTRKALDLCVGKFHPLVSMFLDENVLPNSKEVDHIANNQWYKLAQEFAIKK